MYEENFWEMIEKAKADSGGDGEKQVDLLIDRLAQLEPYDIIDFDTLFRQRSFRAYGWDLWGAAYILNNGCDDDDFMYFRAWLIAQGQVIYEAALENPESLVDVVDKGDTSMLKRMNYATAAAYERVTGDDDVAGSSTVKFPRKLAGLDWEVDELPGRFPVLWAKFGKQ